MEEPSFQHCREQLYSERTYISTRSCGFLVAKRSLHSCRCSSSGCGISRSSCLENAQKTGNITQTFPLFFFISSFSDTQTQQSRPTKRVIEKIIQKVC